MGNDELLTGPGLSPAAAARAQYLMDAFRESVTDGHTFETCPCDGCNLQRGAARLGFSRGWQTYSDAPKPASLDASDPDGGGMGRHGAVLNSMGSLGGVGSRSYRLASYVRTYCLRHPWRSIFAFLCGTLLPGTVADFYAFGFIFVVAGSFALVRFGGTSTGTGFVPGRPGYGDSRGARAARAAGRRSRRSGV